MPITSPHPDVDDPGRLPHEHVLGGAAARGDKPALIDGPTGAVTTYAELAARVRAVAAGLAELGIGKGDAVGLLAPNSVDWPVAFHAVIALGGDRHVDQPAADAGGDPQAARDAGARAVIVAEPLRGAVAGIERVIALEALPEAAARRRTRRRPGSRRPRGAAVLVRHDRAAEGRDAHPPQPRREHRAGALDAPDRARTTC